MEIKLKEFLKNTKVFSSLSEDALNHLLPLFETVELKAPHVLFYQGEISDSIYLLLRGKLLATFTMASGETRKMGYIEPGEIVGEVGALTNETRTLSVKALHDAVLIKMSAKDFIEICHRYPTVMFATIHPIVTRSNTVLQMLSSEKTSRHIVLIAANHEIPLANLMAQIKHYADKYPNVSIFSDSDPQFQAKRMTIESVNQIIREEIKNKKRGKIFYFISQYDSPFAKAALKKANMIYIVGDSEVKPKIDSYVLDKAESRRLQLYADPVLILLHPEKATEPKHTNFWLAQTTFGMHHHVRHKNAKDFKRLIRFLRGRAVGLVLSGGGTRGWAHLGVIKALHQLKIPIDIIGGTSAGAMVGACYAIHQDYNHAYEDFKNIVVGSTHSVSWRSLTWPIISLFNAKRFTESQMQVFDNRQIEDLWLPYFCISSNLSKNIEEIHRGGLLWMKTRASTSIPGLIPPMMIHDDIHLDGGLLNNLPVDVMRQFVGHRGRVIAVELNSFGKSEKHYHFPPILTLKEALAFKFHLLREKLKFPTFIDTFLRALFLSSSSKTKQNSLTADLFINLNLNQFSLLKADQKQGDKMVKIAYQETFKEIQKKREKSEHMST